MEDGVEGVFGTSPSSPTGPTLGGGLDNALGTLGALDILGLGTGVGLDCNSDVTLNCSAAPVPDWVESEVAPGVKIWHILFMIAGAFCTLVIALCCCVRFRIPRTKQEIEADYVRKQITRKFQKQLRRIQNSDMDDMDLKRALDRVRAEFKSDTESLAQSISSSANASVCNSPGGPRGDMLRKSSDIGVSIEDLIERRTSGIGARFNSLVGKLRPRRGSNALSADLAPSGHRDIEAEP